MTALPYQRPDVQAYARLLAWSFRHFTGHALIPDTPRFDEAMWHASLPIVSHGTQVDPVFRYANAKALDLWEMDWDSFTRLPSRLSAESGGPVQSDRNAILRLVAENGWADGYAGIRISSTGRRFEIRDTVLWNVVDEDGVRHGQAALIRKWRHL